MFGSGINQLGCLIDAAEALNIVERKGSWYSYGDVKLGQGRKQAIELLTKDAELLYNLEKNVKKLLSEKSPVKLEMQSDGTMMDIPLVDEDLSDERLDV